MASARPSPPSVAYAPCWNDSVPLCSGADLERKAFVVLDREPPSECQRENRRPDRIERYVNAPHRAAAPCRRVVIEHAVRPQPSFGFRAIVWRSLLCDDGAKGVVFVIVAARRTHGSYGQQADDSNNDQFCEPQHQHLPSVSLCTRPLSAIQYRTFVVAGPPRDSPEELNCSRKHDDCYDHPAYPSPKVDGGLKWCK